MFRSLRARLTLWYTVVLALVLIAFSGMSYVLLARAIRSETDISLATTAREVMTMVTNDAAAGRAPRLDFRYNDRAVLLLDDAGRAAGTPGSHLTPRERVRVIAAARTLRGPATVAGGHEDDGIRLYVLPFRAGGRRLVVAVAHDLDPQADRLEDAQRAVALGIPIALVIAAAGGSLLARKAIDRAFESQRAFMADASHELRTPVAIIQGEADVALSRPRTPDDYRESIETMRKASGKLARIVEDLFLLARTDAGTVPIAKSRFYLHELLGDCVRAMRGIAERKGIDLRCQAPADAVMVADEDLVHRLVLNLVDNAVKFTPEGGRVVVRAEEAAGRWTIRVSDSGRGIPAADVPHVFERFYRAERARGAQRGAGSGAGLGLAIARWVAEAHGGTLAIESSDGSGTTFAAVIPC
jgi:signal transduction histidine kinase